FYHKNYRSPVRGETCVKCETVCALLMRCPFAGAQGRHSVGNNAASAFTVRASSVAKALTCRVLERSRRQMTDSGERVSPRSSEMTCSCFLAANTWATLPGIMQR